MEFIVESLASAYEWFDWLVIVMNYLHGRTYLDTRNGAMAFDSTSCNERGMCYVAGFVHLGYISESVSYHVMALWRS